MERAVFVGFRATEAEAEKVAALARKTRRSKSGVLRLLLEQAELAEGPDIRLMGKETDKEAKHV
jgi:hypothetical protein